VSSGVLGEECLHLIQSFFREARAKKKEIPRREYRFDRDDAL
jgi:hypothetical protein